MVVGENCPSHQAKTVKLAEAVEKGDETNEEENEAVTEETTAEDD